MSWCSSESGNVVNVHCCPCVDGLRQLTCHGAVMKMEMWTYIVVLVLMVCASEHVMVQQWKWKCCERALLSLCWWSAPVNMSWRSNENGNVNIHCCPCVDGLCQWTCHGAAVKVEMLWTCIVVLVLMVCASEHVMAQQWKWKCCERALLSLCWWSVLVKMSWCGGESGHVEKVHCWPCADFPTWMCCNMCYLNLRAYFLPFSPSIWIKFNITTASWFVEAHMIFYFARLIFFLKKERKLYLRQNIKYTIDVGLR